MRLTRRALNTHCLRSVVILATLATGLPAQTGSSGTLVLDLTKPAPREEQTMGVPGSEIGGVVGQPLQRSYPLPLAVELRSISPQPVKPGEKFMVELRLRNTSDSAFYLPASQNTDSVLKQGNKKRRTFLFSLVFEDSTTGRQIATGGYSTSGSETVPSSLLRVEPGQYVRVLFRSDWYPITDALKHDRKQARVRAEVSEWKLEEKRYFIESRAEPVRSDNALMIEVARPD